MINDNKRVLMLGHLAYIIMQFNIPNIKLLIDMGYKVDVACNFELEYNTLLTKEKIENFKRELDEFGCGYYQVDFHRSPVHALMNLRAYKQVSDLLEKKEYKFVHCHSPIGGFIGRLVCKKNKVKVFYTAHGFHFYKGAPIKNWILYYPAEWICSWYTDVLITINKEDYEQARRRLHAKKTVYIPGVGIDVEKFILARGRRFEKRKELGIKEGDILLLSVGELNRNKNHELAIRALAALKKERSIDNIHYYICGQGALEKYLLELIGDLDLNENVRLLGYRRDVEEIIGASDLFLFLSKREGLPMSLMEAMAGGLPCIVTGVRGNTDLVENKLNGFVINFDESELKRKISLLCDNKKIRMKMSEKSAELVKSRDVHIVDKMMHDIYQQKTEDLEIKEDG